MESVKVQDFMNASPVTFSPEMSVASAVEHLVKVGQPGGPVVDSDNKVIGFLSEQDCIRAMLEESYYSERVEFVKDAMITNVVSTCEHCSIIQLAEEMMTQKPKIYPVTDGENHLVGVITRNEVLKALSIHLIDSYKH